VVDQAGAIRPTAKITVTNTLTNATRDTMTNADGLYGVPAPLPGTYTVNAQLQGFEPQVRSDVQLLIGATVTIDMHLGVATLHESITVGGSAPPVDPTQSVLASSIRQVEVEQLPMLNRNLAAMITPLPGAREVAVGISSHGTSANYVSYGGGNGRNSVMLVDGIDNKEDNEGGTRE
jgi:carboxypeptidase family protein